MEAPAVTVLMPVRDGAVHLAEAVDSVLRQTMPNFELLAIDDGSTDETPGILAGYASQDGRVRVVRQDPLGLVAALNSGLNEARAPLVARMDADDIAAPERLARQAGFLAARPEVAAVGSAWSVLGAGNAPRIVEPPQEPAAIRAALQRGNCMGHPTVTMRRDVVRAVGGYRAAFRLAEDYDLWLRLAERHDLANLAEPLLTYREHAGQTSFADFEQRIVSELAALVAARRRAAEEPDGMDAAPVATRPTLLRLGMTEAETREATIARALGAAKDALAAGRPGTARQALMLLLRQKGLRPRTRLHGWLLRLRCLGW